MATIYSDTQDGYVAMTNSNWATARDAATGGFFSSSSTGTPYAIRADVASGRGGTTYFLSRSFFEFDTSGISSNVESATFKVRGYTNGAADIIAVKSSQGSVLATADFDAIVGWSTGSADGSGAGDNESNVTKYSSEITSWNTSAYNDITLNSAALTDMKNDNAVYICLLQYDNDLKDIAPTGLNRTGVYYANYTGTSRDPYIDYTLASTVTDNSVFFGCNF
jgi:hypothetical protein